MGTLGHGSVSFNLRGYTLVSRRVVSNQPGGTQWELLHEGLSSNLTGLSNNFFNKGARVTLDKHGGKCTLSSLWGADPGDTPEDAANPTDGEIPQERWEIIWEAEQVPIFNLPKVITEAEAYVASASSISGAAQYKHKLEQAANNGEANPLDSDAFPIAGYIWDNYLAKGVTSWDGFRPVARRVREYSKTLDDNTTREQVRRTSPVYTRAKLISTFDPPANAQSEIPTDPTDIPVPKGCIWGWRKRTFSYGYDTGTRKVNESVEFDFAGWSRGLYDIIE